MTRLVASIATGVWLAALALPATAQPLGRFRWQLQPYCNVIAVSIDQSGAVYRLEGTDDQCGAPTQGSAVGSAFLNPNGTIGLGLTLVATPGGAPLHVDATITLSGLDGTWRDSAGHSGSFVFTPGAGTGGSRRPTTGTIGVSAVDTTQIQARVAATCAAGTAVGAINQDGTVSCNPVGSDGDITAVAAGAGLIGGGNTGSVSVALKQTANGAFDLGNPNGLLVGGVLGGGQPPPVTGVGSRLQFHPSRAAVRAGYVDGSHWDDPNVGVVSAAFNYDTIASGDFSSAFGYKTTARGHESFAGGFESQANGIASFAFGESVYANGYGSIVLGTAAVAVINAAGSFVFADRSTTNQVFSLNPNEFVVRAAGGTTFVTNAAATTGVFLAPGGTQWSSVSDVNRKHQFRDLDSEDVLSRIAGMPVREWSYKDQEGDIRHIGPTAQDFHAAFAVGEDPLRIGTMDAEGVALAAVRALEQRTRELRDVLAALQQQIEALRRER